MFGCLGVGGWGHTSETLYLVFETQKLLVSLPVLAVFGFDVGVFGFVVGVFGFVFGVLMEFDGFLWWGFLGF